MRGSIAQSTRDITRPEPGYWLVRLVKGGPMVPACILLLHTRHEPGEPDNLMCRSPFLAAYICGTPVTLDAVWLRRGQPIDKREHDFLVAERKWLRNWYPSDPLAQPHKPVDWFHSKPVF